MFAFKNAVGRILALRQLWPRQNGGWMLNTDEKLLGLFVHHDAERAMRGCQFAAGRNVTLLVPGPYRHPILGIAVDVIDVARDRVHINAAVHRDFRVLTANDSLGLAQSRPGRGVLQPVIHHDLTFVFVLENNFIVGSIDRDGAET